MRRRPRIPARLALLGSAIIAFAGASAQLSCSSQPTPPFLLLITADTLRADHVGAYAGPGRDLGLTPGEYRPIQQRWLEAIKPEGITTRQLAEAVRPSRYVRGSDVLDIFGE